ncbi:hypothetical protein HYALB_00007417 [Hymenoscyphus albidus]|uniref:Uncharacterized protein n=1 Tax=Hymenoscyphus albidus TaxID=595503 RepID=A0A9N9QAI9_9HELO|nr:hypothetical protein HYALB_00007417 [Hymenoscyphus albidus]
MNRKKNIERIAKPFAFDVSTTGLGAIQGGGEMPTYDDSVVPGKDCKLIKSGDQIPPGCDVTGYEDRKCEDREWVH